MTGPAAEGKRLPFEELPMALRARVASILGGPVVEVDNRPTGFSPGVAARVRVGSVWSFVKAVSAVANPDTPEMHRREGRALAALSGTAVRVPQLHGVVEEGPWVLLVTEAVPGQNPQLPWTRDGIAALVGCLNNLSTAGTPCPAVNLPTVTDLLEEDFSGWRTVDAAHDPGSLPAWALRNLPQLADLESQWTAAATGHTLIHADVRGDNLVTENGRGVLVDWPNASVGAPFFDVVTAAPAVAMQGGPRPDELVRMTRAGATADPDQVLPLVTAITGYFVYRSQLPSPPGLPTVRPFQGAQAAVALPWLHDCLTAGGHSHRSPAPRHGQQRKMTPAHPEVI